MFDTFLGIEVVSRELRSCLCSVQQCSRSALTEGYGAHSYSKVKGHSAECLWKVTSITAKRY